MKKWDKIIIGILLVISFLPYLFLKVFTVGGYSEVYAEISVDGEIYKRVPLTGQMTNKTYVIETAKGSNTVVVANESIAVVQADCKDQICKQFGWKRHIGDTIVCLPHAVYIEVKGSKGSQNDHIDNQIDIRTY